MFQFCETLSVCFCRTGTNPRTSLIPMPRSLMTGMMRWMGSGSRPWSPILNTRYWCFFNYASLKILSLQV